MAHAPVVLFLARGVAIRALVDVVQAAERTAEALVGRGSLLPGGAEPFEHRRREPSLAEAVGGLAAEGGAEVLDIGSAALDPIPLDHSAIGQVATALALTQVGEGRVHVGGHPVEPAYDQRPLVFGPQPVGQALHLLELPVYPTKRLVHVGVHAPLGIAPVVELVQHEPHLRLEHIRVDPFCRAQRLAVDASEPVPHLPVEPDLLRQCVGPEVAQPPIDAGEPRAIPVATEIRRHDGVELERAQKVVVPERSKRRRAGLRIGAAAACADLAQNSESGHRPGGPVHEFSAMHHP